VNYSARQMYDLVNDIEAYPEFLKGCTGSEIKEQADDLIVASLTLKKGPVNQSFTTRNTLLSAVRIDMELLDGPFDYLHGCWHFRELAADACKIEFSLSFEFSNRLAGMAFSSFFNELASNLVDSFTQRAGVVYGQ